MNFARFRAVLLILCLGLMGTSAHAVTVASFKGKYYSFSSAGGALNGGGNLTVSSTGAITGKMVYTTGAISKLTGKVTSTGAYTVKETLSGKVYSWTGKLTTTGILSAKSTKGYTMKGNKVTSVSPYAGVYYGAAPGGHKIACLIDKSRKITGFDRGPDDIEAISGSISGNKVTGKVLNTTTTFSGAITGTIAKGTYKGMDGSGTFTATRL